MLVRSRKPNENMPESNAKPTSVWQWVVDASEITQNRSFGWKPMGSQNAESGRRIGTCR